MDIESILLVPAFQRGTLDGTENLFLQIIIVLGKFRQQFFGFLSFGVAVSKAGVFHDIDAAFCDKAAAFPFGNVHQRADRPELLSIQIADRGKAVQSAFIEQGHEEGLHYVVLVVTKSDLITPQFFCHIVQGAFAHFRAEGTGVFLFSFFEDDLADVCIHYSIIYADLITECLDVIVFRPGQTQRNSDGFQFEMFGIKTLQVL